MAIGRDSIDCHAPDWLNVVSILVSSAERVTVLLPASVICWTGSVGSWSANTRPMLPTKPSACPVCVLVAPTVSVSAPTTSAPKT